MQTQVIESAGGLGAVTAKSARRNAMAAPSSSALGFSTESMYATIGVAADRTQYQARSPHAPRRRARTPIVISSNEINAPRIRARNVAAIGLGEPMRAGATSK